MTSNGNDEVNHSQNHSNKAQNGVSSMKCGGSLQQSPSSIRKSTRNHNNMGLKRQRNADTAAGMY